MDDTERTFTVAEYIELLNIALKRDLVRLAGEVSQVKQAASGHVYFTLKDRTGEAVMDCIIWRSAYARCGVPIETGMELVATGHPQIYAPTGRFSFVADVVELTGEGALKKAYEALKRKLEAEGLFAPERKRPLPDLPRTIGIVTSREGAVIHDFLNNLGRFGFRVVLVDSRVEGAQAVRPLIEAVRTLAKRKEIEVLVIARGGGSLESLQAFNNESLVRELAAFPAPVVAGIGHDEDVPLAALAADHIASTPTAAAQLLNRSWEDAYARLREVPHLVARVGEGIRAARADLDRAWGDMTGRTENRIAAVRERIDFAGSAVRLNDPARQLALGYAIVRKNGRVVKSVGGLAVGDALQTQLADGTAVSRVENVEAKRIERRT